MAQWFHQPGMHVNPEYFAAGFAIIVTLYFWRKNIIGLHESSQKALRIMQLTTIMVVILVLWCVVTVAVKGSSAVPAPTPANLHFRNRVAEDGVLPDWFRHPHRRFGTTNRAITLVMALQIVTIVITRGKVEWLGAAYAFGVAWSFAMKALSVLVLRYKMPGAREWRVPLNLRVGGVEVPVGLGLITLFLFTLAVVNVFTRKWRPSRARRSRSGFSPCSRCPSATIGGNGPARARSSKSFAWIPRNLLSPRQSPSVHVALKRLKTELRSRKSPELILEFSREVSGSRAGDSRET